jgi:hypothetical protein
MGAWGVGPFDNDDASDFAGEVAEKDDLSGIESVFDRVLTADYVEAPEASEAVAGAEIFAMLLGRPSEETEYPEEIDKWVAAADHVPSQAQVEKGRKVLDRVLAPKSELWELWSEAGESDEWKASVEDVKRRLV